MSAGGQINKYIRVFETLAGKGPAESRPGGQTKTHTDLHRGAWGKTEVIIAQPLPTGIQTRTEKLYKNRVMLR